MKIIMQKKLIAVTSVLITALPLTALASGASHTGLPPQEPIKNSRALTVDEQKIQDLLNLYRKRLP
jgi:hypothetical protein